MSLGHVGISKMRQRLAAFSALAFVMAGCMDLGLGVPVSNPSDTPATASEAAPEIELLSDVTRADSTTNAATRAIAGASADAGLLSDVAADAGGSSGLLALLGASPAPRTGPDAKVISYGDTVAYGEIATVCDAPRGKLGQMIAQVGGFTIYDSNPGATALRPHFIQGFGDRCARQFSAALMMTGDVGTHEVVRYLPANKGRAFNATDSAYEAIKASYCRVSHGKPCGRRLEAFAGETTFITAYKTFGSQPTWIEILLHDGDVIAIDQKSR